MKETWEKQLEELSPAAFCGRFDPSVPSASLRWPLNGIEFSIRCSCLSVLMEAVIVDQAPWVSVFADGALYARFPLTEGRHWYPLLMGMDETIPHRITICNDTQPMENSPMRLQMIAIRSDGQLLPLEQPAYHFEFVGDSLTTGEGCIGPVSANEWKSIWMAPSRGYAHMVCEEMGARASLVSQSGWGVFSDWANNPANNLPRIYDQLCGPVEDGRIPYHFRQKMDAVIINLGTNDISALNSLPEKEKAARAEQLKQSTAEFLQKIRLHNPDAYLLWVYGMCGQGWLECFREGVDRARSAGDEKIGFCPLPPCTAEETGSRMHPGPENHKRAARAIVDHLKTVLK